MVMKRNEKISIGICILIPVLWGLFLVLKYGVNTFYMDEFSIIELADKFSKKTLGFSDLFAQHNEHRMFFPKILFLLLGEMFHYNTKIYMLISILFITISFLITIKMIYETHKEYSWFKFEILGIGFLYFNGVQMENLFGGFQIAWFLIIMSVIVSLYCMQKYFVCKKNKLIIISLLFNIVASFSSMQGLWIWLVFIFLFILCALRKNIIEKKVWIFFCLGMMISFFLYFCGYIKPQGHPNYFEGGMLTVIEYFLVAIGGIFTTNISVAAILGSICVILSVGTFIIWFFEKTMFEDFFLIGIMIYGYLVIASITIGRSGLGIEQALSSRYSTYVLLSIIATLIFLIKKMMNTIYFSKIVQLSDKLLITGTVVICVLIIGLVVKNFTRISQYEEYEKNRSEVQTIFLNYNNEDLDSLKRIYPFSNYQNADQIISIAKKEKINVFWKGKEKETFNYIKNIEKYKRGKLNYGIPEIIGFDQQAYCMDEKFLCINNAWAIDYKNQQCAQKVFVKINNLYYECEYGIQRKDVANVFGNDNYEYSGFSFKIKRNLIKDIQKSNIALVIIGKEGYYETSQFNVLDGMDYVYNLGIETYEDKTKDVTYCIDSIGGKTQNDVVDLKNYSFVDIVGWIFEKQAFDRVYIQYGDKYVKAEPVRRNDVAKSYNNVNVLQSGFNAKLLANWLANGENNCTLYAISDKKKIFAKIPIKVSCIRN